MKRLALSLLFAASLPLADGLGAQAPPPPPVTVTQGPLLDARTYDRVLDVAFPRDEQALSYVIVLRFHPEVPRPGARPPSQIVIKKGKDEMEVIEYVAQHVSIWDVLDRRLREIGRVDIDELGRSITVRRRTVVLDPRMVTRWHAELITRLRMAVDFARKTSDVFEKSGVSYAAVHGGSYQLWLDEPTSEMKMSFTFRDADVLDKPTGLLPVVLWMNTVRVAVAKAK